MYSTGVAPFDKNEALDARYVVNYLWEKAQAEEKEVTPLQMIKLVYYCHGWMLGIYHEPLICQNVEAWQFGPVIRVVYQKLKKYGRDPIKEPINDRWLRRQKPPDFTKNQCRIMDEVWGKYQQFTGIQLSSFTHHEGTPWYNIWTDLGQVMWEKTGKNPVIPDKVIEDYFASWFQQANSG